MKAPTDLELLVAVRSPHMSERRAAEQELSKRMPYRAPIEFAVQHALIAELERLSAEVAKLKRPRKPRAKAKAAPREQAAPYTYKTEAA